MSINSVQFQAGLSMAEFIARYGTEAKCYRALYQWRWPQGFQNGVRFTYLSPMIWPADAPKTGSGSLIPQQ